VARKSKSAQRRMVEMERAEKAGERIGGQLCRSKNGLFVNCNSGQATPESISKLRKQAGIADTPADTGPDTSGASKLTQETIAKRRAAIAARRAEADKKKKGGGGGKGKEEKPSKLSTDRLDAIGPKGSSKYTGTAPKGPAKEPKAAGSKRLSASQTAARVGLSPGDYDALRSAAEDGAGGSSTLSRLGLTSGGEATDQGRRALSALERGNVREYRAALQDARARLAREATRKKVKRTHSYWQTYRRERKAGMMPIEARKAAKEQVLRLKLDRNHRQRNALASAMIEAR
jgi:hypothetical protein